MRLPKVMIACDLSETDKLLFEYLQCLSQKVGIGEVQLVHVIKNPLGFHDLLPADYEQKVAAYLGERFQQIVGKGVPYRVIITEGSPVHEIVELANTSDISLVIVGDKMNRKGVVAHKIARRVQTSAVFVPDVKCPVNRILLPVDMSPYSQDTVRWGLSFAREWNAEVIFLHVYSLPPILASTLALQLNLDEATLRETTRERAETLFKERIEPLLADSAVTYSLELIYDEGRNISEVIAAYANQQAIDLTIVGAHGEGPVSAALFGSVPEGLIKESMQMPLWIYRKR